MTQPVDQTKLLAVAKLSNSTILTLAAMPRDFRAELNRRAVLRRQLSKTNPAVPEPSITPHPTPERPWDAKDCWAETADDARRIVAERIPQQ